MKRPGKRLHTLVSALILSLFFVVMQSVSGISVLLPASTASAIDAQECFDTYNGKDIGSGEMGAGYYDNLQACKDMSICDTKVILKSEIQSGYIHITCTSPNSSSEESTRALQDKEVGPLVKLYCGDAPAGENAQTAYLSCVSKVREAYFNDCNSTGGSITSEAQTTSEQAAKCMVDKDLGAKIGQKNVKKAIDDGRAAKDAMLTEKIEENLVLEAKSICDARIKNGENVEWKDSTCVEKASTNPPQCTGGPLGWFLCPIANMLAGINSIMIPAIEGMLKVDIITDQTKRAGVEAVWRVVVGFANLALVIAFLVVIFSQATSMGLSAYGIKKMLPRIIAASILINLSFFITSIAIDVFNILGGSAKALIDVGITALNGDSTTSKPLVIAGQIITGVLGLIQALAALLAGVAIVLLVEAVGAVVATLVAGTIAILAFFMGIALREILIVLFVIAAPLAFAAMVLPNTEPLFKKWWSGFLKLLMIYPVAALIMEGSYFVALLILKPIDFLDSFSPENTMSVVIGYLVLALGPPLGTMMYIKNSNSLIAKASGAMDKFGRGLGKLVGGGANALYKRSALGVGESQWKNSKNEGRLEEAADTLSKEGSWQRRLTTLGLSKDSKRAYGQSVLDIQTAFRDKQIKAINEVMTEPVARIISSKDAHFDGKAWHYVNNEGEEQHVSLDSLDDASRATTEFLHQNDMLATTPGGKMGSYAMRSAAMKRIDKGTFDETAAKEAANNIDNGDVSGFTEWLNTYAASKGLTHMTYNSTVTEEVDGKSVVKLVVGGSKISVEKRLEDGLDTAEKIEVVGKKEIAKSYVGMGLEVSNKYVNADRSFQPYLAAEIRSAAQADPAKIWASLSRTSSDKLSGIVRALRDGNDGGPIKLAGVTLSEKEFYDKLEATRKEIGGGI